MAFRFSAFLRALPMPPLAAGYFAFYYIFDIFIAPDKPGAFSFSPLAIFADAGFGFSAGCFSFDFSDIIAAILIRFSFFFASRHAIERLLRHFRQLRFSPADYLH